MLRIRGGLYRFAEGQCDTALTDRGRRQVEALSKHFSDKPFDAVYSSVLRRARDTASVLAARGGKPVQFIEELQEIALGAWEGANWGNIAHEDKSQLDNFRTLPYRWHAGGCESAGEAVERLIAALKKIAAKNDGAQVAVVSHGYVMRLVIASLKGLTRENSFDTPEIPNTGIFEIEFSGGELRLVSDCDTRHLLDVEFLSHEKPRQPRDFDTDMIIHQLSPIEFGEVLVDAVSCVWDEAGEDRAFDREILLSDANTLTTYIGYVDYEPAGFVQLGMDPGRITLLCTHPGERRSGLGIQLIGRAVLVARANGSDYLRVVLPNNNPYRDFFLEYGFTPIGETANGREVLEKDIGLDEI